MFKFVILTVLYLDKLIEKGLFIRKKDAMEIYSALPYDIVKRIRQNMVSQDDVVDGKDSSYASTPNGKIEIRFSNHCTRAYDEKASFSPSDVPGWGDAVEWRESSKWACLLVNDRAK